MVIQKSIREGFGLTVCEALWNEKPFIGGAVGRIKLQVIDVVTGLLVHSPGGSNPPNAAVRGPQAAGAYGRNRLPARQAEFLITRHWNILTKVWFI